MLSNGGEGGSPSGCSRCWFCCSACVFLHRSMTESRHSWHSCTGWRCRSASSLSWLFWHTDAYTRQLRRTFAKELHQSSADEALQRLRSAPLVVRRTHLYQPSAIELFRSLLPDCGTLCRWTSRRHRQYLFSWNVWRPISSVILPCISCSACAVTCHFVHCNRSFCLLTYLLTTR